jgi:hypothetical protein
MGAVLGDKIEPRDREKTDQDNTGARGKESTFFFVIIVRHDLPPRYCKGLISLCWLC